MDLEITQNKSKQYFEERLREYKIQYNKGKQNFYNIELPPNAYKVLVRSFNGHVNTIPKSQLPEVNNNIFIAIVWYKKENPATIYLVPSTELKNKDSKIFKERNYDNPNTTSKPEWGLNFTEGKEDLLKDYEFSKVINELSGEKIENEREKHYWVLSAGENAEEWEYFKKESVIAVNFHEYQLGDLSQYSSKEEIKTAMKSINESFETRTNDIHALWQFANEIQIEDIVYIKNGRSKIIGRGIVKSDYQYDGTKPAYKHIRKMKWTNIGEWESPFTQPTKTLTDITSFTDDVTNLENIFANKNKDNKYTNEDYLKEVFQSEEQYETLKSLLLNKKNIILQGCPGVGKSFSARKLAYSIMEEKDDSRIKFIQFHQNYSYEDFIMGYKPDGNGFTLKKGVFYDFCETANERPDKEFFFIIDEINRGNLSKIFGELLLAIENNYRGYPITLAYTEELFTVPKNLYIIGMMNTADRSLAMIDYALRRRFSFYQMNSAFDSEGFKKYQATLNNPKFDKLIEITKKLNEDICKDESLGEGFCIGHSYFCNKNAETCTDDWMKEVVNYDILPTLKEYWFDDKDTYKTWKDKLTEFLK